MVNPDAMILIAALTLAANTSRFGSPPRNRANRSRAVQSSGGRRRTKKSVGSAASWRRRSVTWSKTGRGSGPNEPVFRFVTAGSSIIAARAAVQSVSLTLEDPGDGYAETGQV